MGFKHEKRSSVTFSASPVSPGEPLSVRSRNSEYLVGFEKKDLVSQIPPPPPSQFNSFFRSSYNCGTDP
jgi:hypothetical protein